MIALLLPLGLALFLPFGLLVQHLAGDPAVRAAMAERPTAAIQLLLALALLGSLLWWPLLRFVKSLTHTRSIAIDRRTVTVTERGLLDSRTWCEPVVVYIGVAHRVRASLSGVRTSSFSCTPTPRVRCSWP
jgi:hypothetical protein